MEGKRFEDIVRILIYIQLFLASVCVGSSPCMPESDRFGGYTVIGGSGNTSSAGVPSGSRVQVSVICNVGETAQSVTTQCSNGTWIPPWPRCKLPCSVPRNSGPVRQFVNGEATRPITSYYTRSTLPVGTQLVARCRDPGKYRLIGDQRRTCEGGQWTGEEPECQPVETQFLFYGALREIASNGTIVVYVHRGHPMRLDVVCYITSVWMRPPRLTTPLMNDEELQHWNWQKSHGKRLDPISTDFSGMYTCSGTSSFHSVHILFKGETIDIDSDVPTTNGLITDDEDFGEGISSGDGEEGEGSGPPDQTADLTCDYWPCENGGTCYLRGETPMCTCAQGWEGAMCEDVLPSSGAVIRGIVETTENYTAALEDTTSLAYKKFEKKFIDAIMRFYAQNHPEYVAYHEDTKVTDFEKSGKKAIVHFEVYFSQLDNDSSVPDAHTVLLDQVNTRQLGPFAIITGTITKTET